MAIDNNEMLNRLQDVAKNATSSEVSKDTSLKYIKPMRISTLFYSRKHETYILMKSTYF